MPQQPAKRGQQIYLNPSLHLRTPKCSVLRYPPRPGRTTSPLKWLHLGHRQMYRLARSLPAPKHQGRDSGSNLLARMDRTASALLQKWPSLGPRGIRSSTLPRRHDRSSRLCQTPTIYHGHTQSSQTPPNSTLFPAALNSIVKPRFCPSGLRGKNTLQSPYVESSAKYYQLEMRDKADTVSVDRLEPSHRDDTQPPQPPSEPITPAKCSNRRDLYSYI